MQYLPFISPLQVASRNSACRVPVTRTRIWIDPVEQIIYSLKDRTWEKQKILDLQFWDLQRG